MHRPLLAFALAYIIFFAASVPVYASHVAKVEPTADEKRLLEKIIARLEAHGNLMPLAVDDAKRSLSETVRISFSCMSFNDRAVESMSINVRTDFVQFDSRIVGEHRSGILGGIYVWECTMVKDQNTIRIECANTLMLNPDFLMREDMETDERRTIAMAENEMVVYHELLHAQLMINAMKGVDDVKWRQSACTFFADNDNRLDYGPSDGDHRVISVLELQYLDRLIQQQGGVTLIKTIYRNVGDGKFTELVATFDELGMLARTGFFVYARAINMDDVEILVNSQERTIFITGSLQDPSKDGIARVFIIPQTATSNVIVELAVDDTIKNRGSEFVFTASIHNLQNNDLTGTVRLGIDGMIVSSKEVDVAPNSVANVQFTWQSPLMASKHFAVIDGFNTASNVVEFFTFERLHSVSTTSVGVVTEQVIVDPETRESITVAKPNRITGMVIVDDDIEFMLVAPDGTNIIGADALISDVGGRTHIVSVADQTLAVRYIQLNENTRFFAVKSTVSNVPLPSGEWSIRVVDADGRDVDTRIRYYANYIAV